MKKDNNLLPLIIKNLSIKFDENSSFVLENLNLSIKKSGIYGVIGASGSGKTTLLNIVSGMLREYSGSLKFGDLELSELDDDELLEFRRNNLGFIFQESHLIEELDILENIGLKGIIKNENIDKIREKSRIMLENLNMDYLISRKVSELSTGEGVRISILRAIYDYPPLVIADEPTGNLDSKNSEIVMKLLEKMVKKNDITLLIATHDKELFSYFDTTFEII